VTGNDGLANELASAERRVFEASVRWLVGSRANAAEPLADVLVRAIRCLDDALSLGPKERDRRLTYILGQMAPDDATLAVVARWAQAGALRSKNAILLSLPPHLRQSLYREAPGPEGLRTGDPPAAPRISVLSVAHPVPVGDGEEDHESESRAALLLGTDDEHASNITLLAKHSFATPRCETEAQLQDLLRTPLCGIVVGGSWWKQFAPSAHEDALKRLCGISSLLWLRIDVEYLDAEVARNLPAIQRSVCTMDPSSATFCHASGCKLTEADVGTLSQAAAVLRVAAVSSFHPAEISAAESMLLRAAAAKHLRGHHPGADVRLHLLKTSFFANGRSEAKIVFVQPGDGGAPFVVKLGPLAPLKDEMERFRQFVERWDDQTRPELHFHDGVGAIVFRLIDAADSPGAPAPTLRERIEKMMNAELGSWGEVPPDEENLTRAMDRVVARLAALNAQKQRAKVNNYGWMSDSVGNIVRTGVTWQIAGSGGAALDVAALAAAAADRVRRLDGSATTHGDVHLDNILVSDDRDPSVVDYAQTGPGHPCFDLVRLNAAVTYKSVRMLGDEARVAGFLRASRVHGHDYTTIARDYPELVAASGNRLAARTGVTVRKRCLELLAQCGGDEKDYVAMELLVACHALTMIQPQSGIVRAAVRALADPL
jgi:hypothetical protein